MSSSCAVGPQEAPYRKMQHEGSLRKGGGRQGQRQQGTGEAWGHFSHTLGSLPLVTLKVSLLPLGQRPGQVSDSCPRSGWNSPACVSLPAGGGATRPCLCDPGSTPHQRFVGEYGNLRYQRVQRAREGSGHPAGWGIPWEWGTPANGKAQALPLGRLQQGRERPHAGWGGGEKRENRDGGMAKQPETSYCWGPISQWGGAEGTPWGSPELHI